MIERVNGTTVPGPFIGAFNSTDEIAIFTGHTPDYGVTVSMIDSDEGDDFVANVGEIVGNIYGRVYLGSEPTLDIKNVVYGEGASKYLISNGTLHVFNGLEKRLPMYDRKHLHQKYPASPKASPPSSSCASRRPPSCATTTDG